MFEPEWPGSATGQGSNGKYEMKRNIIRTIAGILMVMVCAPAIRTRRIRQAS